MNIAGTSKTMIVIAIALASSLAIAGGNADNGKKLFAAKCVMCHGAAGKGDGAAAASLNPKPRDLTDSAYMKGLSDQHLTDLLKKGGAGVGKSPLMPASGLKDEEIPDVVAYMRTLSQ